MDCKVNDGQIIPVKWRIPCDLAAIPDLWPTDDRAVLAYSNDERDAIAAALDELKIPSTIDAVDQPNAAHLALLQGTVSSRSEALAALEALGQGETPAIPELRLKQIEAKVATLESAKEAQL